MLADITSMFCTIVRLLVVSVMVAVIVVVVDGVVLL